MYKLIKRNRKNDKKYVLIESDNIEDIVKTIWNLDCQKDDNLKNKCMKNAIKGIDFIDFKVNNKIAARAEFRNGEYNTDNISFKIIDIKRGN